MREILRIGCNETYFFIATNTWNAPHFLISIDKFQNLFYSEMADYIRITTYGHMILAERAGHENAP